MPVAAIAMVPAPEYFMNGTAASTAIATHVQTGVCRLGATRASGRETGSWRSRDIPKHNRIVAARIDKQQTKIAAETTSRYRVANGEEKLASMICAGPHAPAMALCMLGIAISVASRNTPPMMNAPITDESTALGALRRGSRVSSDSVDAVSKP